MDRFNSNEDPEETPLSIAKDIVYSDGTLYEKVKQIESAIIEARNSPLPDFEGTEQECRNFIRQQSGQHPSTYKVVPIINPNDDCQSERLHKLLQYLSDEDELAGNRTHQEIIDSFNRLG